MLPSVRLMKILLAISVFSAGLCVKVLTKLVSLSVCATLSGVAEVTSACAFGAMVCS